MQAYELATLTLRPGNIRDKARFQDSLAAIDRFCASSLLGSFTAEIGPQNRVTLLRGFASVEAMMAERVRVLNQAEPFVPADRLAALRFESFLPFPGVPPIEPGAYGPYYEFRTYELKIGGLAPTTAAWAKAIPGRTKLSPLVTVMHALDGVPRFIHVWAYRDLPERERIRAEAFASGVWPAPGAPDQLTENLRNDLLVPTANSRLR